MALQRLEGSNARRAERRSEACGYVWRVRAAHHEVAARRGSSAAPMPQLRRLHAWQRRVSRACSAAALAGAPGPRLRTRSGRRGGGAHSKWLRGAAECQATEQWCTMGTSACRGAEREGALEVLGEAKISAPLHPTNVQAPVIQRHQAVVGPASGRRASAAAVHSALRILQSSMTCQGSSFAASASSCALTASSAERLTPGFTCRQQRSQFAQGYAQGGRQECSCHCSAEHRRTSGSGTFWGFQAGGALHGLCKRCRFRRPLPALPQLARLQLGDRDLAACALLYKRR